MNQFMMLTPTHQYHRNKAFFITLTFALAMVLLLWFLKWKLPVFEKSSFTGGVEVEVNWPPDPPESFEEGGGGGGNPVEAINPAGAAPSAPLPPGENTASKAVEEDPLSESPSIAKPNATKKEAKSLTTNSSNKTPVKKVESPAPPKPKAVMGKTIAGTGTGGGSVDNFERTGGQGSGWGAGQGSGAGGGTGTGMGGGIGSGSGTGTGPRVTRGDRKIVKTYSFEGDLNKATVYANILVAPDGSGKLMSLAKGSSATGAAYKQAISKYLERMRFDAADHESMVTVQFNFRVN
jgi:hypothetical protein